MAVLVQRLVAADRAGIAFSANPVDGDRSSVAVNASWGLGETVVQGAVNPDEFYVYKPTLAQGRPAVVRRNLGQKAIKMIYSGDAGHGRGIQTVDVPAADRQRFCLSDAQVEELARYAVSIEQHYQRPMDIEWALDGEDGRLFILQARPETVKSRTAGQQLERYALKARGDVLATGQQRADGGDEEARHVGNGLRALGLGGILLVTAGLGTFCLLNNWEVFKNYIANPGLLARSRNFYGILEVTESETESPERHKYSLLHGTVRHGFQYRQPQRRNVATAYYGNRSGVGLTLRHHPLRKVRDRQFRVGVIGLGAGTISSYINDWDVMTTYDKKVNEFILYYEINPDVLTLAEKYFTFLLDARERGAQQGVYVGDARIVMERQLERGPAQNFDVLVVDAFSGDAPSSSSRTIISPCCPGC